MSYRIIVFAAAFAVVLAFCTSAVPKSLDLITNDTLKAYAESELEYGAPSIPAASTLLYRDALKLLGEGDTEGAIARLELAAGLTGDYAAPLFTLARVELLSANPDFLPNLMEGFRRMILSYPSQAMLSAKAAAIIVFSLIASLLSTLIALIVKYREFIDHKIAEARTNHLALPSARWIIVIACVALALLRLGLALYIAILVIALWVFMTRREKGVVVSLVLLLSAASFSARYSNCLAPAIDPESVTSRLVLINRQGVSEMGIARIQSIGDGRFRSQKDFAIGTMMYRFGIYEEARKHLLESVSIRPDFAPAFLNLGNVYFMQGDYDKALAGYQSALQIDSTNAVAYYNIGQTYIKKMLFAQSSDWLERATTLGIESYRSAHPAMSLRNPAVYEQGFRSGELWSIATAEGKTRHGILLSEMLQPYLLFPFHRLWMLLLASIAAAMILARKLPEAWLVGRCDNCGKPTCTACADTQMGIRLCRSCADVIGGLSSIKVMEALLRTRRQKIAAIRQKRRRSWKLLFFPGISHTYHDRILSGAALSFLGAAAVLLFAWRNSYLNDPRSTNVVEPIWSLLPPLAAIVTCWLLSLRAKRAPQEQSKYHIIPNEIRMQQQEREDEAQKAKANTQSDPWKDYDAGVEAARRAAAERARVERAEAQHAGAPAPKKAPQREEVGAGQIEKGSKWH